MEDKISKQMFKVFNFNSSYEPPTYKYNKSFSFIEWGDKNKFPNYILDLYNSKGASTFKAIINKKTKLIAGNGIMDVANEKLLTLVKSSKLEKQIRQATLDYTLFNAFAFEVVWDKGKKNITSIQHIPISNIRLALNEKGEIDDSYYWFCKNWINYKKEEFAPEAIKAFNPANKTGKQLYVYYEYNPDSTILYSLPEFSTAINWIEFGYEISKFHLNQVKQGYSPSFVLNFATGIPSEEEMDEFARQFKKEYGGADNSGKIIITYSEGADQKPELIKVDLNDSDKRFVMLKEQMEESIIIASEMPVQLLLSVAGKLGSVDERKELMEEFQFSYVDARQDILEEVLNEILFESGFNEEIQLKKYTESKIETTQVVDREDINDLKEETDEQL
jgi:hypothetical protein